MNSSSVSGSKTELAFTLSPVDGWPPVSIENLPSINMGDYFQIDSPPLFIKDLSVGDLISVRYDNSGHVYSWKHVQKSERSLLWVLRISQGADIELILGRLRSLGCNTVFLRQYGIGSVDVPSDVSIGLVDELIEKIDGNSFAITFSSFRHKDGE
jgi:hypothetical protein